MAALFTRRADHLLRAALLTFAVVVVLTPIAVFAAVRAPLLTDAQEQPIQPIPFDHRHHARDDGIDCRYCHSTVERGARAGMPATSVCLGCHAQVWRGSPLLAPLHDSEATQRPIRWRRVMRVPDFVFFDHHAHTRRGIDCSACHGAVDEMPQLVVAHAPTMGFCIDCHSRNHATLQCVGCHR